jgi:MFS superfamily sulfate permease-like transporter
MNRYLHDLRSSLVVFLVALPLCLGIALASGAPLFSGLIAGIIGGIVIGLISNSSLSVSGPAAGLTVIVASAIIELGDYYTFTLAVILAGIIQMTLGSFSAGKVGDYFPNSVIKGMLAAIGIILILKQIPHAFGYDADWMGDESFLQMDGHNTFSEILFALKALNPGAVAISTICTLLILGWNHLSHKGISLFKIFPSALAAVIAAIGINHFFSLYLPHFYLDQTHLVSLNFAGGFEALTSKFHFPNWSAITNPTVFKVAVTLAVVGSLETLLSIDAIDKIDPLRRRTNKNRELVAQGSGNIVSGLLGGLPITSVIVRSSANLTGGAKSKLSAVLHGIWLLLCVTIIPHIIELIPLAALAAILIIVGFKLTKPSLYKEIYLKGLDQFAPFFITIVAIIFTDLLLGIFIGMVAGILFVIKSNLQHSIDVKEVNKELHINFTKDVTFFHKSRLIECLDQLPENSKVRISKNPNIFVDADILFIIEDFTLESKSRNIDVIGITL